MAPQEVSARGRLSREQEVRLREYIDSRLDRAVRLGELASVTGLRVHDFLRAFRASFGTTPAQYVLEQRVGRARWLLKSTRKDITEIALETGFSSHAHLSMTFRKRVGMPPAAFRALRD